MFMGLRDMISKVKGFVKETNKVKKEGKEIVSYKNTYAAFNLIKLKTENRIFIFSTAASLIFLGVYAYQIYLNVVTNSITHIVVYSILALVLISSLVFNISLNPMIKNKMSSRQKNRANRIRNTEKNIELVISTAAKLFSLGYMVFEIITIEASRQRIIPFVSSGIALFIQLLITYISKLIISYYNILLVGIDKDISSSGIIDVLSGTSIIDGPFRVAENVKKESAEKIFGKIQTQIDNDELVKEKNEKDLLYKVSICLLKNMSIEEIKYECKLGPKKINEILKTLEDLEIIRIDKAKKIELLTNSDYEIKTRIYYALDYKGIK